MKKKVITVLLSVLCCLSAFAFTACARTLNEQEQKIVGVWYKVTNVSNVWEFKSDGMLNRIDLHDGRVAIDDEYHYQKTITENDQTIYVFTSTKAGWKEFRYYVDEDFIVGALSDGTYNIAQDKMIRKS